MNFSVNLKNLRESQNITQEQLADYLQVSRPTIAGYETKSRQPDFERLEKISQFFHVSIDYLLTGSEFHPVSVHPRKDLSETLLNQSVLSAYKKLSIESKQDVLEYIKLLQLRDSQQQHENL